MRTSFPPSGVLPLLLSPLLLASALADDAAMKITRNLPYAASPDERNILDVYAPAKAKNLPVVVWIHGGGWQQGDKKNMSHKPELFTGKGLVFVAMNYRLLPKVEMEVLTRDVAKSVGWVHKNIAEHGGDPQRLLLMGHSAGAQLAALLCTDERYLQAEGVPFSALKGCVPVDGDTYDIPAIIETAETRRRVHHQPQAKYGHREKFGHDPAKHRDFSAVTHIAKGKGIPPFLVLFVANHPDNSAQANRLGAVLLEAGVSTRLFGARNTDHVKLNDDLGAPDDLPTKELLAFLDRALKP